MKNSLDFSKISDKNGNIIGALNFNNMIPVKRNVIVPININPCKNDSQKDKIYKELMNNQLDWCNDNIDNIVTKANRLYILITEHPEKNRNLTRRCCDFKKLEAVLEKYISHSSEHSAPEQNGKSTLFSRSAQKSFVEKAAKQLVQQQKDKSKDDITH